MDNADREKFWKKLGAKVEKDVQRDGLTYDALLLQDGMEVGNNFLLQGAWLCKDPANPDVPLEVLIEGLERLVQAAGYDGYDIDTWVWEGARQRTITAWHDKFEEEGRNKVDCKSLGCPMKDQDFRTTLIAAIQAIPEGSGIKTTR